MRSDAPPCSPSWMPRPATPGNAPTPSAASPRQGQSKAGRSMRERRRANCSPIAAGQIVQGARRSPGAGMGESDADHSPRCALARRVRPRTLPGLRPRGRPGGSLHPSAASGVPNRRGAGVGPQGSPVCPLGLWSTAASGDKRLEVLSGDFDGLHGWQLLNNPVGGQFFPVAAKVAAFSPPTLGADSSPHRESFHESPFVPNPDFDQSIRRPVGRRRAGGSAAAPRTGHAR